MGNDQREQETEKWEQILTWTLDVSANSLPILFLVLIFIFPLPVLITRSRFPVLVTSASRSDKRSPQS